ncbi:hypothetical protein CK498_06965 [Halomonas salipaludis]|uniref:Uncharacterized protein n=2 Tax=Halomonas salipaludis TaxID=2032625 RepID=A0A2A2F1C4_9GAMM|nr:hypothetical protein CK498_06965 [Halomonas salipaludis]
MSQEMMQISFGMLFLAFLLVVTLRSHGLLWPYVAFLLFEIVGVFDFVVLDDEKFGLAINEVGSSYKYSTYDYLASLMFFLSSTFYFVARHRTPRQ